MEKIGCITYNNIKKELVTTRSVIKDFILKEDIKDAIENNNFDYVFKSWNDYAEYYLPRSLIRLFLEAEVDFLPHMSKIPNSFFENCEFIECVEIPANIKEIGWNTFKCTNLKKFIIKKRSSNLYISSSSFDMINDTWNLGNKTDYEFEGTREEFDNLIDYNSFSDAHITFNCSDGEAKI